MTAISLKGSLPQAVDYQKLGKQSLQLNQPIVVFVSASHCEFCHLVQDQVFIPTYRAGGYSDFIFTRLLVDGDYAVKDFTGEITTPAILAQRLFSYELTPSLLFVNAIGEQLSDPIIGVANVEYYEFLMLRQVQKAQQQLAKSKGT